MRGKGTFGVDTSTTAGITPAYAGKSRFDVIPYFTLQDHPRLCGEKRKNHKLDEWRTGSPPPMRGKGAPLLSVPVQSGITPAYAGKR